MSALATLSKLPREAQRDALASVTQRLLPHPTEQPQPETLPVSLELERKVLDEIRQRLKIKQDDVSPSAQAKIFNYISQTLSDLILQGSDVSKIRERLGERGSLPPREYQITYPKDFANFQRAFAIRPNHVTDTLRNPTYVQHLSGPKDTPQGAFLDFSLYASVHATQTSDPFSLLVICIRRKDTQEVSAAWRVYHADVTMPTTYTPLDMFRAFTALFGTELTPHLQPTSRVMLYERRSGDILPVVAAEELSNRLKEGEAVVQRVVGTHLNQDDTTYISLAYAVDVRKYVGALLQRGINVHPELVTWGDFNETTSF